MANCKNEQTVLRIGYDYLPLSFKTPKEQEYIEFLWDAFETNSRERTSRFVPPSILLVTGRIPIFSASSRFTTPYESNFPMNNCRTSQQAIVAEIEAEQALVAANRELITRFEQKIQATLARIWGENAAEPFGGNA
ncbi:MAG: hypothetical protein IPN92_06370 [Chromatiaceae bacterium]|nr:hypothetical protein [Chromatiaceae bacterium]